MSLGRMCVALGVLTGIVAFTSGCHTAAPMLQVQPAKLAGMTPAEADAHAEAVQQDPIAHLRRVLARCHQLDQYTLVFVRQERRGLFQTLTEPEVIQCWFRREPFSVRMKWNDPGIKYKESVYVEGQADNRVRFVTRWWVPPLKAPPGINTVDLQTPVTWGESKRPLTDFGLERMMERTLAAVEGAGDAVIIKYEGLRQLEDDGPIVHHLHLEYPPGKYEVPIQELYVQLATDLPAGTVLKRNADKIDALYLYRDINTDVKLTDADFLLEVERPQTATPDDPPATQP